MISTVRHAKRFGQLLGRMEEIVQCLAGEQRHDVVGPDHSFVVEIPHVEDVDHVRMNQAAQDVAFPIEKVQNRLAGHVMKHLDGDMAANQVSTCEVHLAECEICKRRLIETAKFMKQAT